jgi:energy-coupling factor transport system permease protein
MGLSGRLATMAPADDAGAGESWLSRRNPVIKLVVLVIVALTLTFVFDPVTPSVIFVVVLIGGWTLGRVSLAAQLRPLAVFIVAGIAILVANILFNKNNATSTALAHLGPVTISSAALLAAGSLWLRLLCFALISIVFTKTTSPERLILSLTQQLRINYRFAFGTMVGYRMLPLLQADYQTIRAAQRVRGVHEKHGPLRAWSRMRRYALPLFAGVVRRGGRVALAMDSRAFGALPTRTYRRRLSIGRADLLLLASTVLILAVVIVGLWFAGVTRFTLG